MVGFIFLDNDAGCLREATKLLCTVHAVDHVLASVRVWKNLKAKILKRFEGKDWQPRNDVLRYPNSIYRRLIFFCHSINSTKPHKMLFGDLECEPDCNFDASQYEWSGHILNKDFCVSFPFPRTQHTQLEIQSDGCAEVPNLLGAKNLDNQSTASIKSLLEQTFPELKARAFEKTDPFTAQYVSWKLLDQSTYCRYRYKAITTVTW